MNENIDGGKNTFTNIPLSTAVTGTLDLSHLAGTANTGAFFDASGVMLSNLNYRYNNDSSSLILGKFDTSSGGSLTGNIGVGSSVTGPNLVVGEGSGISSIVSGNFGGGSIVFGHADTNGTVIVQFSGSLVGGVAQGAGQIGTESAGSFSMGQAVNSGQVVAHDEPTFAFGYANGAGAVLGIEGAGSLGFGYVTDPSSILVSTTGKHGQFTGGYSFNTGNITTDGDGAFTFGVSQASGALSAGNTAAVAFGYANGHNIQSAGHGSFAVGDATNGGISAGGNGSFAGGFPFNANQNLASGDGSFAFGGGQLTSSGVNSVTFGVGNLNPVYDAIVGGQYASVSGTATSWVATDPLFVLGNGISTGTSNAFSILKNGNVTAAGTIQAPVLSSTGTITATGQYLSEDGTAAAPGISFTNQTNAGLYRVGADEISIALAGTQGLDLKKSTTGFINIGLPASVGDGFPIFASRTQDSSGTAIAVDNPSLQPNSSADFEVSADNGNVKGYFAAYTSSSTVPPYVSSVVIRGSDSMHHTTIASGGNAGDDVRIWTNGDFTAAGETASFNGDHSTTLFGLLQLPVQASGTTPTCGAGQNGGVALTHAYVMCVCNGTGWVQTSDGSTTCTF